MTDEPKKIEEIEENEDVKGDVKPDESPVEEVVDEAVEEEVPEEVIEKDDPKQEVQEDVTEPQEESKEEPKDDSDAETKDEPKKEQTAQETIDEVDETSAITINAKPTENAQWFVVHTYSGHEVKVAHLLKQRTEAMGKMDQIFKILIPHKQKIVVSEGKKRKVDERLFPGYIIVHMVMNDDSWHLVRSTRGVTGFVGTGSNPTPLPESEVKNLVEIMRSEAPKFEAKFTVGDSVKITEGPFADFLGKVDDVNEEQGKLQVLVSVFGRETPVELDFTQVKSI